MNRFLLASLLLIAGCSAASSGSRQPGPEIRQERSPVERSLIQPGDRADGLPIEAFDLLTKSMTDSCSICARNLRKQGFQVLEGRFRPGDIVRSDSLTRLTRAPGAENALIVALRPGPDPKMTFRFHTAEDHLVGIAESDMTDAALADRVRSAPDGTAFHGTLEILAYPYGDGPTFLYHEPDNSVEVQCKILEIAVSPP